MDDPEARTRDILACLGDPSRFRLVLALLEGELCVTELAGQVGLSQSCTTRHLQYLGREGLVRGVRQGKRVVFQLRSDRARVRDLLAWVTASSHESPPRRVAGADVHTDGPDGTGGPMLPGGARRHATRHSPRRMPRERLAAARSDGDSPESIRSSPAPDRDGAGRADSEAAPGRPQGESDPAGDPGASPGDAAAPINPGEMEDWLL